MDAVVTSEALVAQDLARSGLVIEDLDARVMSVSEKAATRTSAAVEGYVIPYYNLRGINVPYYRVRLFDNDPKYKAPKDSKNHVYFPKDFYQIQNGKPYILLTEGEKKAKIACKLGFPCVALAGVDSWRNRQVQLPKETELTPKDTGLIAKLPSGQQFTEDMHSPYAEGFTELVDHILRSKQTLVIVYDSDLGFGTKPEVQRAAAALGFELRYRGIRFDRIRQLILPGYDKAYEGDGKLALDDFLVHAGPEEFANALKACLKRRSAFPRHPNIQEYVSQRLQYAHLSRKDTQQVSMAMLSDLDANGLRLYDPMRKESFYFDYSTHQLYRAEFATQNRTLPDSPFSTYLYRKFGISGADRRVQMWLEAQFTGEEPVEEVSPYRVFAPSKDSAGLNVQINDGQYAYVASRVDGEHDGYPGLEIYDNGDRGILFEAGSVQNLSAQDLATEYGKQFQVFSSEGKVPCWWLEVFREVRLPDRDRRAVLASLLYYASPWLYRWKGTQLPVEMILGEPGSGKSTLCELRLQIISGDPRLRNAPHDLRDWYASVASSSGLHVTDNLQLVDRNLRQRLSDEICRIITEPKPSVELRKLFSTADILQIPVRTVFAITSIQQPFTNPDIIQRSIILELDKAADLEEHGEVTFDSQWMQHQIQRFGGRTAWIAHHLFVLHRFFELVEKEWSKTYKAKHRLVNLEQILMLMGKVFGIDVSWLPDFLSETTGRSIVDADWAFEGIVAFAKEGREKGAFDTYFAASDIATWAIMQDEYRECEILINSRKLGRYLKTHKSQIHSTAHLAEAGYQNNRQMYRIQPTKK